MPGTRTRRTMSSHPVGHRSPAPRAVVAWHATTRKTSSLLTLSQRQPAHRQTHQRTNELTDYRTIEHPNNPDTHLALSHRFAEIPTCSHSVNITRTTTWTLNTRSTMNSLIVSNRVIPHADDRVLATVTHTTKVIITVTTRNSTRMRHTEMVNPNFVINLASGTRSHQLTKLVKFSPHSHQ